MLELCSIASGSSGNCICVGSDNHHVLIDAGISGKRIENGLNEVDLKSQDMDGILVTHEHLDHIAGLGVMARRYGLPMYATAGTIEAIKNTPSVGKIDPELFHEIVPQEDFVIGDLTITPIHISHDAADPVAYRIKKGNRTFAVVTDLGNYDDEIVQQLQGLDTLLLEANHDIHMLETGVYPYPLKRRKARKTGEGNMHTFRFATEEDVGLILKFIRDLAEYEKMSDQVVATEALLREWIFEKHRAEVLFICEGQMAVGFALFFVYLFIYVISLYINLSKKIK